MFSKYDYRKINYEVMTDTKHQYETLPELKDAVRYSVANQFMIVHEDVVQLEPIDNPQSDVIITGNRSFEAAKAYQGKKVAVLNFANNHSIGGNPFFANAQEEALCRCSTLLPCLEALTDEFYEKHIDQYESGEMNYMGNDDLIYTPDVVVFKTDERSEPICPQMMPKEEWYKVDVITSAAPELWRGSMPSNYEECITSRIKKILDVAAKQNVEVLILGAWGCGAFRNPSDIVARVFLTLLKEYNFDTVEFALGTNKPLSENAFACALGWNESGM